jgi:hypothetical protein
MEATESKRMDGGIRPYRDGDAAAVAALWSEVFPDDPPWNEPNQLIAIKLRIQP